MAQYVYPAIFTEEENGQYSVRFPDVKNCFTGGDSLPEAMAEAADVLSLMLYDIEQRGGEMPPVSDIRGLALEANEFASMISCDTTAYLRIRKSRPVKKTLTIPEWLNDAAIKAHLNFSRSLQDALIAQLNL